MLVCCSAAPAEGVASFAVLAPVAAAAVPTPVAATSYAVAVDDSVATEDNTSCPETEVRRAPLGSPPPNFDLLGQEPLWD